MGKEIRCAVLGLGRLGYLHAVNVATKIKGSRLVAVSDVVAETASRVAQELDVPFWSMDPDEVINREDVDAVIVVTPTTTHAEIAKKVARAKKALFLEKPIALDINEAHETAAEIEKSGIICQLGFMRRFDPGYEYAKQRILAGDIGKPLYFKGCTRDPRMAHESYVATCGGIFADLNIHDFDIARYLMGQEIVEITAMGSVLYSEIAAKYNDVDQAISYLRFDSGAAGDVEGYRNAFYGYDIRAEIMGTEGTIVVSGIQNHSVTLLHPNRGSYDIIPFFMERFEVAYLREMEHFIASVQNNEQPSVGARDGVIALAVALAARQSNWNRETVQVAQFLKK
jgi:scyllo-inositol 2-dehydrogenase (NAD+)